MEEVIPQEVVIGTCEDMCPLSERITRIQENDVHKLEVPSISDNRNNNENNKSTMIKKFQRSSADHALQIAEMLRTPETLLRTISYIETVLMFQIENNFSPEEQLHIYLFIWDRYRMIGKDFILQLSGLSVTDIWVECHERMARWFIFQDHYMNIIEDYVSNHKQQNGEQINNLLKTLDQYYSRPYNSAAPLQKANQAEFMAYFLLFQIGNKGEVAKYLLHISGDILSTPEMKFAIAVWTAYQTENFTRFFMLLRQSNLLQACIMFRYVRDIRVLAIGMLCKAFHLPGQKTLTTSSMLPVADIQSMLMFESINETIEFLRHCGIELYDDDNDLWAIMASQNIKALLPRDKNGLIIMPRARVMTESIGGKAKDSEGKFLSIEDICKGLFKREISLPMTEEERMKLSLKKKFAAKAKTPSPSKSRASLESSPGAATLPPYTPGAIMASPEAFISPPLGGKGFQQPLNNSAALNNKSTNPFAAVSKNVSPAPSTKLTSSPQDANNNGSGGNSGLVGKIAPAKPQRDPKLFAPLSSTRGSEKTQSPIASPTPAIAMDSSVSTGKSSVSASNPITAHASKQQTFIAPTQSKAETTAPTKKELMEQSWRKPSAATKAPAAVWGSQPAQTASATPLASTSASTLQQKPSEAVPMSSQSSFASQASLPQQQVTHATTAQAKPKKTQELSPNLQKTMVNPFSALPPPQPQPQSTSSVNTKTPASFTASMTAPLAPSQRPIPASNTAPSLPTAAPTIANNKKQEAATAGESPSGVLDSMLTPRKEKEMSRLMNLIEKRSSSRLLQRHFLSWRRVKDAQNNRFNDWIRRKYFRQWRKLKMFMVTQRQEFFESMQTIRIVDPCAVALDSVAFTSPARGRQTHTPRSSRSAHKASQVYRKLAATDQMIEGSSLGSILGRGTPLIESPLCSAVLRSQTSAWMKVLSLDTNSQHQRQQIPVTARGAWPGDVIYKLVVFSPCLNAGLFSSGDCPTVAAVRALLCNDSGFLSNFPSEDAVSMRKELVLKRFENGVLSYDSNQFLLSRSSDRLYPSTAGAGACCSLLTSVVEVTAAKPATAKGSAADAVADIGNAQSSIICLSSAMTASIIDISSLRELTVAQVPAVLVIVIEAAAADDIDIDISPSLTSIDSYPTPESLSQALSPAGAVGDKGKDFHKACSVMESFQGQFKDRHALRQLISLISATLIIRVRGKSTTPSALDDFARVPLLQFALADESVANRCRECLKAALVRLSSCNLPSVPIIRRYCAAKWVFPRIFLEFKRRAMEASAALSGGASFAADSDIHQCILFDLKTCTEALFRIVTAVAQQLRRVSIREDSAAAHQSFPSRELGLTRAPHSLAVDFSAADDFYSCSLPADWLSQSSAVAARMQSLLTALIPCAFASSSHANRVATVSSSAETLLSQELLAYDEKFQRSWETAANASDKAIAKTDTASLLAQPLRKMAPLSSFATKLVQVAERLEDDASRQLVFERVADVCLCFFNERFHCLCELENLDSSVLFTVYDQALAVEDRAIVDSLFEGDSLFESAAQIRSAFASSSAADYDRASPLKRSRLGQAPAAVVAAAASPKADVLATVALIESDRKRWKHSVLEDIQAKAQEEKLATEQLLRSLKEESESSKTLLLQLQKQILL